ncbi:hypothetical protein U1Q18_043738, partial [Sarracenia purpurea var. burkii]
ESNCLDSMCRGAQIPDHVCEMLKLLHVEADSFANEDEFDDDEIDPAMKEKIDREVEDFARRLNSDWPERMQEILSLGQERPPEQTMAKSDLKISGPKWPWHLEELGSAAAFDLHKSLIAVLE